VRKDSFWECPIFGENLCFIGRKNDTLLFYELPTLDKKEPNDKRERPKNRPSNEYEGCTTNQIFTKSNQRQLTPAVFGTIHALVRHLLS